MPKPKPAKKVDETPEPAAPAATAPPKRVQPSVDDSFEQEDFLPQLDTAAAKPLAKPRLAESPLFLWMHRPDAFYLAHGKVVPFLAKLKVGAVGVNGVGQGADGKPLPREAINSAVENGAKIIPWDVDGPGTNYIRRPKGMPNVHLSRFEKCFANSGTIVSDETGYVEWLEGLVKRGVLPPCPPRILHRMYAEKVRELDHVLQNPNQAATSHKARLEADVKALEDAIKALGGDAEEAETESFNPTLEPVTDQDGE